MSALPNALRSRKASVIIASAGAASAAVAVTLFAAQPAAAVPAAASVCAMGTITVTPASGWVPLTSQVTTFAVNTDRIKAEVTADVGVVSGAEVRLGWGVLGTAPAEGAYGPANFANHQEFDETRTTFALITIGTGDATVQPFVRVSGPSGATATLLHRCVTAEGQTS
jgi:hypothetical protein